MSESRLTVEIIAAHEGSLVRAAFGFRRAARALMGRLVERLALPGDAFADAQYRKQLPAQALRGDLEAWRWPWQPAAPFDGWSYSFHGSDCRFAHRSGQVVGVRLGFGAEYGVLDPHYFSEYLCTTAEHSELRTLIEDPYFDGSRILEVLGARGALTRHQGERDDREGWCAHEPAQSAANRSGSIEVRPAVRSASR